MISQEANVCRRSCQVKSLISARPRDMRHIPGQPVAPQVVLVTT